jgi:hypothetical protein
VVGVGMFAYWQLCVPSVELSSTLAIANKDVAAVYQRGELDAVALGQHVSLRISARPGRLAIPVTKVYAIVEPAANGEKPWIIPFAKTAGDGVFESEIREVKALAGELAGQVYKNPNDGVVREIRVIVRNAWGIEQEVPLKLRVKPEPDSRRRV